MGFFTGRNYITLGIRDSGFGMAGGGWVSREASDPATAASVSLEAGPPREKVSCHQTAESARLSLAA
jgi:hypothetical protein